LVSFYSPSALFSDWAGAPSEEARYSSAQSGGGTSPMALTVFKSGDMAMCTENSVATINKYCEMGLLAPVANRKSDYVGIFDPRQIPQFYVMKMLRELGLNKQQVLDYGQNHTPETVIGMFSDFDERISEEIAALQKKLDVIQSYLPLIREGHTAKPGIELRGLPEQHIRTSAIKTHNTTTKSAEFLRYSCGDIRQNGNAACPMGFAFNEFLDLLESPNQPAQLVSFDPQGPENRPAGEYLVGTVDCYYGEKLGLPRRMSDYAMQNGLEFHGPAYTVYLLDAVSVMETEQYLLQIAVGVRRL